MSIELSARLSLGSFAYEAEFSADGELVVLFGHSGAGKSVTLQAVAGLMRPREGRITVDGTTVFDSATGVNLAPQQRNVGYVVQDLALFPHMTVAQNVAFGIRPGVDKKARTRELLELLGLTGYEDRKPRTLSGGQQQRVALARALARDARVLLLDEPFSALDDSLRAALRRELLRLRREFGLTVLFVTHDLREAHLLADRIAVFDAGRILQYGARDDVFRHPASRRVAELTGVANILSGTVTGLEDGYATVRLGGISLDVPQASVERLQTRQVDLAIRGERVNLRRLSADTGERNLVGATIVEEYAYGATHALRFALTAGGPEIEVELAARPYEVLDVANQKEWLLELPPSDIHPMAPTD